MPDLNYKIDPGKSGGVGLSGTLSKGTLSSSGIFSRDEIQIAKYNKFYRYGSVLDPYNRMTDTIEYLFFVKPDLHIMDGATGQLNPELNSNPFFLDLLDRYPDVINQLQLSSTNNKQPFATLLSFGANSSLDLSDITLGTMDTPATIYGTSYPYLQDGESSDENVDFSLEFKDTKNIEIYQFFKTYSEYQKLKKYGRVSPEEKYILEKRLHNVMGVYRFLVSMDDYETIVHYSYLYGVMPLSVPRSAFSNSAFADGLTFSVNFQAAFIEDMEPMILTDFNNLVTPFYNSIATPEIPVYDAINNRINGDFVSCPYIKVDRNDYNNKKRYRMVWR